MFKSLLAAALISVGTILPATAAPMSCAFIKNGSLDKTTCDVSVRKNANGHNVTDVVFFEDGQSHRVSIVFWTENGVPTYAELFHAGERVAVDAYRAKNGAWCISNNGIKICLG